MPTPRLPSVHSLPAYRSLSIGAPWATQNGGGLFSSKDKPDYRTIDDKKLAQNIQSACVKLDAEGYVVISIIPMSAGFADTCLVGVTGAAYGYGRTVCVIITAARKQSNVA